MLAGRAARSNRCTDGQMWGSPHTGAQIAFDVGIVEPNSNSHSARSGCSQSFLNLNVAALVGFAGGALRALGDTPSRDEVLRQNAADRMSGVEADAAKWAVVVAVPKEARELSAAAEFEQEEAARLVRRGPLFEDQNFAL